MILQKLSVIFTLAVGFIVIGLCCRFGVEKFITDFYFKKYNDSPPKTMLTITKYTGVTFYICGWLIASICLALKQKNSNSLKYFVLTTLAVSAVWSVFEIREEKFLLHPKLPLISCSVLLTVMVSLISLRYKLKDVFMIVIASNLIILSEFFILPYQRKNNVSDGIGLPVLILGWILLFNSFKQPSLFKGLRRTHREIEMITF